MAKRLFSGLVGVVISVVFFSMFYGDYGVLATALLSGVLLVVSGTAMRFLLGADRIITDDAHYGLHSETNYRKSAKAWRKAGIR